MTEASEQEPDLLINDIDAKTRANIFSMDQKLKGLKAEIDAKIKAISLNKVDSGGVSLDDLNQMSEEIALAIEGIDILVTVSSTTDEEMKAEFLESEEARLFSRQLEENLEKIKNIKANF